jgi:hypothetical protein
MEMALNLEWIAMAIAMCWLWMRHSPRDGHGRSAQFVSLGLVLVTMFVVITMYDDMAMAQNPAEIRCFQRDDKLGAHAHAQLHPVANLTPLFSAEPSFDSSYSAVLGNLLASPLKVLATTSIQSRPPPAA